MQNATNIRYLNTDLYLAAPISLEPLTAELERLDLFDLCQQTEVGEDGQWSANYSADNEPEPEINIVQLLDAIGSLSESSRLLWDACTTREFDIGYDCGDEPWAFTQRISNSSLRRIADCGAVLKITIYPNRPDRDPEVPPANPPATSCA